MFNLEKRHWQWVALLFLAFVWGASFILMKLGLNALSYVQVGAFRMLFGFIILLPIALRKLHRLNRKNFWPLLLCGLLGNFFPAFLFALSETQISSSLAGILNGLTPFFTLLVGVLIFKNRPTIWQYVGIFVGFIGAAILVTDGDFTSFGSISIYAMFIVVATLMYGVNANMVKYGLSDMGGVEITALIFLMLGPLAIIVLLFTDVQAAYAMPAFWPSILAVLTLATFGSVITLFIYYNLINKAGAIFASSTTYITPFFALIWGVLYGEEIGVLHIVSLAIILVGVYLSGLRRKTT